MSFAASSTVAATRFCPKKTNYICLWKWYLSFRAIPLCIGSPSKVAQPRHQPHCLPSHFQNGGELTGPLSLYQVQRIRMLPLCDGRRYTADIISTSQVKRKILELLLEHNQVQRNYRRQGFSGSTVRTSKSLLAWRRGRSCCWWKCNYFILNRQQTQILLDIN